MYSGYESEDEKNKREWIESDSYRSKANRSFRSQFWGLEPSRRQIEERAQHDRDLDRDPTR